MLTSVWKRREFRGIWYKGGGNINIDLSFHKFPPSFCRHSWPLCPFLLFSCYACCLRALHPPSASFHLPSAAEAAAGVSGLGARKGGTEAGGGGGGCLKRIIVHLLLIAKQFSSTTHCCIRKGQELRNTIFCWVALKLFFFFETLQLKEKKNTIQA